MYALLYGCVHTSYIITYFLFLLRFKKWRKNRMDILSKKCSLYNFGGKRKIIMNIISDLISHSNQFYWTSLVLILFFDKEFLNWDKFVKSKYHSNFIFLIPCLKIITNQWVITELSLDKQINFYSYFINYKVSQTQNEKSQSDNNVAFPFSKTKPKDMFLLNQNRKSENDYNMWHSRFLKTKQKGYKWL